MARGNRMEMTWRLGGNLPSGQLQKRHGDTCWPQHPHVFWDGEAACQNRSPHSYRKKIAARGWPGVYLKDCNHRETFRPLFPRGNGGMDMEKQEVSGRSHVRWVVLLLLCLMYLITYLDRVSLANT